MAGAIADRFGMSEAVIVAGVVTILSGALVAARMPETLPGRTTPAQSS